jgi:hypothetical protein
VRKLSSRLAGAALEAGLISLLVIALLVVPVFAARGGGGGGGKGGHGGGGSTGGTGTVTMQMVDPADTTANYGDFVTFTVSTTATTEPWVNLKCWQNGTLVAEGWNGYFDRSITGRNFGLYSPSWNGGAAECTAYLTTPQWAVLGSTSFHVDP